MKRQTKKRQKKKLDKKAKLIRWIGIPLAVLMVVGGGIAIYVKSLTDLVKPADFTGDPTLDESDIFNPDDYVATPTPELDPLNVNKPRPPTPTKGPSELQLLEIAHEEALDQISMASDSMVYNVLLIGTDNRGNEINGRSDAMMILSVNKRTKTIHIASLMRALYVKVPGRGYTMLNAAFSWGGASLLIKTIEYNFKVPIHDYVLINFGGFEKAIDTMGGISINLSRAEANYLNTIFPPSPVKPDPTPQETTEGATNPTSQDSDQTSTTGDSEETQTENSTDESESSEETTIEQTESTTQETSTTETTSTTKEAESSPQLSAGQIVLLSATIETLPSVIEQNTITPTTEQPAEIEVAPKLEPTFTAGSQSLNGAQALAYARIRKIDSDFQRTGRQRAVIEAVISRTRSMSLGQLDRVARQILPLIKSSRSGSGLLSLIADGYSWRNYPISQKMLPISGSSKMIIVRGAEMYQYDVTKNINSLQDFLYR